MRPESAFYFFKSSNEAVEKSAVTTLVTYRKRKIKLPLYRVSLMQAMQKLYAARCTPGTLRLPCK